MGESEGIGKMIGYLVLVLSLSMICESKFNTCQQADHICEIAKLPKLELPPCCAGYERKALEGSVDKFCVESEDVKVGEHVDRPTHHVQLVQNVFPESVS